MTEGSNRLESGNDNSSSRTHGVGGSSFTANKLKKKKKTKAFPGLSNSRAFEGGLPGGPLGKVLAFSVCSHITTYGLQYGAHFVRCNIMSRCVSFCEM